MRRHPSTPPANSGGFKLFGVLALVTLVLIVAGPARAQEAERRRVAVLISTTGELDPAVADGLTELLIGAVAARGGVTIVGKEELQAQLGQGEEGTLRCVSSMACVGRVGVQLDVVEVIAGTLARREGRWIFNIDRIDVRAGAIRARVFREVEGDLGAVADALGAAIPELYAPEPEPAPVEPAPNLGTLVLRASVGQAEVSVDGALIGVTEAGELRRELEAGAVEVRVSAAGHHAWGRTVRIEAGRELALEVRLEQTIDESPNPWVWVGGGLAVISLAAAIPLGVSSQASFDFTDEQRLNGDVTRLEVYNHLRARQLEAISASVLYGLAGALAASALIAIFFPDRRPASDVALLPTPGGLLLRGEF